MKIDASEIIHTSLKSVAYKCTDNCLIIDNWMIHGGGMNARWEHQRPLAV